MQDDLPPGSSRHAVPFVHGVGLVAQVCGTKTMQRKEQRCILFNK